MHRLIALLSGEVQGVGLEAFIRNKGLELGLTGAVEATSDNRVEVVAEGSKEDLIMLVKFLWQGTRDAKVHEIELDWSEPAGITGFVVH